MTGQHCKWPSACAWLISVTAPYLIYCVIDCPAFCLICCPCCRPFPLQSLFGRMMNTLEELDTAADAFRKRYLAGQNGLTAPAAAARGAPPPAGSPTPSDTEFALLDAAYGSPGSNANTQQGGAQAVAAMNRALDTVQEAEQRGGNAGSAGEQQGGCCGMGGRKPSSASWFTQFR